MELSIIEAGYGLFGWVIFLLVTVTMAAIALLTTSRPWNSEFWSTERFIEAIYEEFALD